MTEKVFGVADSLRITVANARLWDGPVMTQWDQIRHQVETRKGSDLPRLNFEQLVENFCEDLEKGADEIERLRNVLQQFADNKLGDENCASVEVAARRIRAIARAALAPQQSADRSNPNGS